MPEPSVYHSWSDIYKILKPSFLHNAALFILHTLLLLFRVMEDKEDPQEDQENLADQWVGETLVNFFLIWEKIFMKKNLRWFTSKTRRVQQEFLGFQGNEVYLG